MEPLPECRKECEGAVGADRPVHRLAERRKQTAPPEASEFDSAATRFFIAVPETTQSSRYGL